LRKVPSPRSAWRWPSTPRVQPEAACTGIAEARQNATARKALASVVERDVLEVIPLSSAMFLMAGWSVPGLNS
jgi:hypothetical protein